MFSRSKSKKTKKKALKNAKGARAEATKKARAARGDATKQAKKGRRDAVKQAKNVRGALVGSGSLAGHRARATGGSLVHSVSDAVGPRAQAAAGTVRDRTAVARERAAAGAASTRKRAVAGFDRGVDGAVPRAKEGVASVGPKVDQARDAIVDDLLPRIQEMLGSVQVAKDDLLSRQDGPAAVVTGAPKKQRRKGGVLISLGLLSAVGAAVSYFLSQKSDSDDTDPWAGSSDRPIGGAPGVDTQVRESGVTVEKPPLKEDAVGHDTTDSDTTDSDTTSEAAGLDSEATDPVADGTPTTETGLSSDDEPQVRMIEVDDVPGTDDDARAEGDDQDKPQT
ncbi:MAG: hypothetical protein ACR2FV_02880 [Ornithinimicrobium sp.]|uniref:hypothetical protein n=1 Tax=Ornithinimicrobium sp. TaxID=1977084 RepID=UPI003D9BF9CD